MTSSNIARRESSRSNYKKTKDLSKGLQEKKRAIAAKYRDRGASGKQQWLKELKAAEDAFLRATEKQHNKLFEDAYEVEHRHLTSLTEALNKKFKVSKEKIKTIMETFGGTTEDLYIYVEQNKYTI